MVPNGGFSCLGYVSNFDQTAPRVCAALAAAGGLQFPDRAQRHQAIISLGALFSLAL